MSNDADRKLVDQLIKDSTQNGHLNLDVLRQKITDAAEKIEEKDQDYRDAKAQGLITATTALNDEIKELNKAAREVLLKPKALDHDQGNVLYSAGETVLDWATGGYKGTSNLVCTENGMAITEEQKTELLKVKSSLQSQGISCDLPTSSSAPKQPGQKSSPAHTK